MNEEKMSMTEGTVWKNLVRFAIPLLLGWFSLRYLYY